MVPVAEVAAQERVSISLTSKIGGIPMMKRLARPLLITVLAVAGPMAIAVTPSGAAENLLTVPAQFSQAAASGCRADPGSPITARVEITVGSGNAVISQFKDPACSQMNSIVEFPVGHWSTTITFEPGFFYQFSGDATSMRWLVVLTPDK